MARFTLRRTIACIALGLTLLPSSGFAQAAPTVRPTQQELASVRAAGKDWITYGGSTFNQRYSTLDQINTTNVQTLKGAWMTRLGSGRGAKYKFEADPLVVDGVMYIPTGNDDIFALDAKVLWRTQLEDYHDGYELWSFRVGWGIGASPMTHEVGGQQYVAVAVGGNRGGVTTLDGDAVWSFALNGTLDEVAAAPPVIYDGTVMVDDFFFTAKRVQAAVGDTVSWKNNGALIHTATDSKGAWNTGDIAPGESKSVTFDAAGTFTYNCSPHPWMIGQVIVQ